jgi:MOSC domain-containing protein YiiM
MESQQSATAIAGKGLVGDRYFSRPGYLSITKPTKSRDITIISMEDIQDANAEGGVEFKPEDTRRNIVVTGMKLNGLVGKTILLGDVRIQVTDLCEAGNLPTQLSGIRGFKSHFKGRAGIRGQILTDGNIKIGSRLSIILQTTA